MDISPQQARQGQRGRKPVRIAVNSASGVVNTRRPSIFLDSDDGSFSFDLESGLRDDVLLFDEGSVPRDFVLTTDALAVGTELETTEASVSSRSMGLLKVGSSDSTGSRDGLR